MRRRVERKRKLERTVRSRSFEHRFRSLSFDNLLESLKAVGVLNGLSRSHHHTSTDGIESCSNETDQFCNAFELIWIERK